MNYRIYGFFCCCGFSILWVVVADLKARTDLEQRRHKERTQRLLEAIERHRGLSVQPDRQAHTATFQQFNALPNRTTRRMIFRGANHEQ